MANLTAPRDDEHQTGNYVEVDTGTNKVYHGAVVTAGVDGYAHPGAPSEPMLGVAQETVDGGLLKVYTEGVVTLNCLPAVADQASVGKGVVLTDDNTVELDTGVAGSVRVGMITKIESNTSVRVKLNVGLASA